MIELSYKVRPNTFFQRLEAITKSMNADISSVLTKAAIEARLKVREDMQRSFNSPTTFTINSVIAIPANRRSQEPYARLLIRDYRNRNYGFNTQPGSRYIAHNISGGTRKLKGFEKRLISAGILPKGMYVVPGKGARLNANGNVSMRQVIEVMQSIGLMERKNNKVNSKNKGKYFVSNGERLHAGIWKRTNKNNKVSPLFMFVSNVNYKQVFDFEASGSKAVSLEIDKMALQLLKKFAF